MEDRRQYKRTELVTYARVYDNDSGDFLGYVCDMSPSGLMTINTDCTEADKKITLRIEVPPLPVSAKTWMYISARSAWCQPDLDPQKFNIGWQFLSTTVEDQEIISEILSNYDLYEHRY